MEFFVGQNDISYIETNPVDLKLEKKDHNHWGAKWLTDPESEQYRQNCCKY